MSDQLPSTEITPQEALDILETYRQHPADFYYEVLGAEPWDMQVKILESVMKNRETSVKSCHGTGKSFNAARIALTFLLTHPGSIVVTTAPTWRQVKDVLWRELSAAYNRAGYSLGGSLTKVGLEFDDDWYAIGLSTTEPDKFQGYHSDNILVIVDEAAGIEEPIFEGVRAITSNDNAHILYIGNPTSGPETTFAKSFRNPRVQQFTISAFDTPNFTANNIRNTDDLVQAFSPPPGVNPAEYRPDLELPYPALVSPVWVYERYMEWGTDSPMWQSRVMGEFPSQADTALIPLNLIEGCMDDEYRKEHGYHVEQGNPAYGVDVARFGSDRTVIFQANGGYVAEPVVIFKQDLMTITDRIIDTVDHSVWHTPIRVDDTGLGGGVTDALNKALRLSNDGGKLYHYRVIPINFGESSSDKEKFYNKRAEMYWTLRELIINKKIALPKNDALANELASIRYEYTNKQQIKIEPKDDIKKRTGRSPDLADALVLAFSQGAPSYADIGGIGHSSNKSGPFKPNAKPITAGLFGRRF